MQAVIVPATRDGIAKAATEGLIFPVMAIPFGVSSGTHCFVLQSINDVTQRVLDVLTEGFEYNPNTGLPKLHLITAPTKPVPKIGTGGREVVVDVVAVEGEFIYLDTLPPACERWWKGARR